MDARGPSLILKVANGTARTTTKTSVDGNSRLPILRNPNTSSNRKGATLMANRPPPVKPGAVPDQQTRNEIENVLNAHRKLDLKEA
jgi:hypothetical protein